MLKPILFIVSAAFTCLLAINAFATTPTVLRLDEPRPVKAFNLVDDLGNDFSNDDLVGSWSLVFLGFTSCPDVCPRTMQQLEGVRAQLGLQFTPDKIPNVIFVAVDPDRDQKILGEYLAFFHPANVGLTGEHDQLKSLVSSLDGFYRIDRKGNETTYDVSHTAAIAVLNPQAELVAKINPPFDINITARELMLLIRNRPLQE